jgi:hypothetical protein
MDIVRNFIKVSGIVSEEELPANINGNIIQYSETETIFIPNLTSGIQSIFHIMLQVDLSPVRKINTPYGVTVILDGIKTMKILYSDKSSDGNASLLNLETPYNAFVEIPKDCKSDFDIKLHILDGYFKTLGADRIYCYIVYLITLNYSKNSHEEIGDVKNATRVLIFDEADNSLKRSYGKENEADSIALSPDSHLSIIDNKKAVHNKDDAYELFDIDSEYL